MSEIEHKEICRAAEWASTFDKAKHDPEYRGILLSLGAFRGIEWLHENGYRIVKVEQGDE